MNKTGLKQRQETRAYRTGSKIRAFVHTMTCLVGDVNVHMSDKFQSWAGQRAGKLGFKVRKSANSRANQQIFLHNSFVKVVF
jgi:hypothetical protein